MAMAGVTDAYGKGPEHSEKMQGTAKLIVSMLRTWSGPFEIQILTRRVQMLTQRFQCQVLCTFVQMTS